MSKRGWKRGRRVKRPGTYWNSVAAIVARDPEHDDLHCALVADIFGCEAAGVRSDVDDMRARLNGEKP